MSSLNWNALLTLATAAVVCGLPFVSLPPFRTRSALLFVRSATRKDRRRPGIDAR